MGARVPLSAADILAATSRSKIHALAVRLGVEDYVIEDARAACQAVLQRMPQLRAEQALQYFQIPDAVRQAGALRAA